MKTEDASIANWYAPYKPPKLYRFDPNDEITAYDLALILECLDLRIDDVLYQKMYQSQKCWFVEEENETTTP